MKLSRNKVQTGALKLTRNKVQTGPLKLSRIKVRTGTLKLSRIKVRTGTLKLSRILSEKRSPNPIMLFFMYKIKLFVSSKVNKQYII